MRIGKAKERIIQKLGREEVVEARGDLDRVARCAAGVAQRSKVLSSWRTSAQRIRRTIGWS